MSNRFYHKSLLSQNRFYHKSLLSQNRFYHKSLLSQNRFYHNSKARPGTTVRPPRASTTYWTTTDNTRGLLNHAGCSPDAIGGIENKSRTAHHVKSLLSQTAFITNHDQRGRCRSDLPVYANYYRTHMMYHHWYTSAKRWTAVAQGAKVPQGQGADLPVRVKEMFEAS